MPGKVTITRNARAFLQRLFTIIPSSTDSASEKEASTATGELEVVEVTKPTLAKELSDFLKEQRSLPLSDVDTFSKEIGLFIARHEKTIAIRDIHNTLMIIPPTFVEAERVFSAGGLFLTKLRSSMSDMTLDKLMFLKFFFKLRKDKVF